MLKITHAHISNLSENGFKNYFVIYNLNWRTWGFSVGITAAEMRLHENRLTWMCATVLKPQSRLPSPLFQCPKLPHSFVYLPYMWPRINTSKPISPQTTCSFIKQTISATEICTQYAERVNLWIARGNFLSTEEISGEVRREIEKHSISQGMFSQKILRRKQATLSGKNGVS